MSGSDSLSSYFWDGVTVAILSFICHRFYWLLGFSHVKVVALSGYQFNNMNGRQRNWLTKNTKFGVFFLMIKIDIGLLRCQFQILSFFLKVMLFMEAFESGFCFFLT